MMAPKKMIPSTSNPTRRQFNRIQLTFRATAAPTRHEPMVMKNAIVLPRLVIRISSREIVVEKGGGASTVHSRRLRWESGRLTLVAWEDTHSAGRADKYHSHV